MNEVLYKKVTTGKRTTYVPLPTESGKLDEGMTAGEIVTAVGTLAVLAINGYQQMLDEKTCQANRVKGVQEAVLKMFKDTGSKIDPAINIHVCTVWNRTMLALSGGADGN